MLDQQPGAQRGDEPANETEVVAPWGDGLGDFVRWRAGGLMTWGAWRVWMFAIVGVGFLVTGVIYRDNEGIVTGAEASGVVLALFFVPPLLSDAFKRFQGRIGR